MTGREGGRVEVGCGGYSGEDMWMERVSIYVEYVKVPDLHHSYSFKEKGVIGFSMNTLFLLRKSFFSDTYLLTGAICEYGNPFRAILRRSSKQVETSQPCSM